LRWTIAPSVEVEEAIGAPARIRDGPIGPKIQVAATVDPASAILIVVVEAVAVRAPILAARAGLVTLA
jgi:hypothetical protein